MAAFVLFFFTCSVASVAGSQLSQQQSDLDSQYYGDHQPQARNEQDPHHQQLLEVQEQERQQKKRHLENQVAGMVPEHGANASQDTPGFSPADAWEWWGKLQRFLPEENNVIEVCV